MKERPFTPLPGETFEYVTEDYRMLLEQVSMEPLINAYHIDGKGYTASAHQQIKPEIGLCGLSGCIEMKQD